MYTRLPPSRRPPLMTILKYIYPESTFWLSGEKTDVADATRSSYQLQDADGGKTVKVPGSFTDDEGFSESPPSEPPASVIGRPKIIGKWY